MPVGEKGKLFGSVNNATIVEELTKKGISVERKKIEVPGHNIKMIGTYSVEIKLYGQESAKLKLIVFSEIANGAWGGQILQVGS